MLTKACLSTPILECAHSNSLNRALNTMNGSMAATSMKQKAAQCLHGAFAIYLASTLSQRTKRKSLILQMARHLPFFKNIMTSITDRSLWCTYGPVRLSFKEENEDEELLAKNSNGKTLLIAMQRIQAFQGLLLHLLRNY